MTVLAKLCETHSVLTHTGKKCLSLQRHEKSRLHVVVRNLVDLGVSNTKRTKIHHFFPEPSFHVHIELDYYNQILYQSYPKWNGQISTVPWDHDFFSRRKSKAIEFISLSRVLVNREKTTKIAQSQTEFIICDWISSNSFKSWFSPTSVCSPS
jgi:hypothetical protein